MAPRHFIDRPRTIGAIAFAGALAFSAWAIAAQTSTTRPDNDDLNLLMGQPDPSESILEDHLSWALDVIGGADVSDADLRERLSTQFLAEVPPDSFHEAVAPIQNQGPYRFYGFDRNEDAAAAGALVAGALVVGIDGKPQALTVTIDPSTPDLLAGMGISPIEVDRGPFRSGEFVLHLLAGWMLLAAGTLIALFGRPKTGWFLAIPGLLWLLQLLELADADLLYTAGLIAGPIAAVSVVIALVAVPGGGLRSRVEWLVVGSAAVAGLGVVSSLFAIDTEALSLPRNLLSLGNNRVWAERLVPFRGVAAVAAVGLALFLLVRQFRADWPGHRALVATTLGGVTAAVLTTIPAVGAMRGPGSFDLSQTPMLSVAAISAAAGLAGSAFWQRYDLGAVASIFAGVGTDVIANPLQPLLAQALGDPDAILLRWDRDRAAYVDTAADIVVIEPDGDRTVTLLGTEARPLGAILHRAGPVDAERVSAACGAVRLTLENEQLHAEVKSQLADVQASRARILEAEEAARRQVERDLHDGAQQRLLALLLALRNGQTRFGGHVTEVDAYLAALGDDLRVAIDELRILSRGLHPAILGRGIVSAAESLAESSTVPATVTATGAVHCSKTVDHAGYFVISEALTNTSRHSRASHVEVAISCTDGVLAIAICDDGVGGASVRAGSGLANLEDRVLALAGTWQLTSPLAGGTRIEVTLPCG